MKKEITLAIIAIAMLQGLFAIGKGLNSISGNFMADTGVASTSSLIALYFITAAVVLACALVFLIKTYGHAELHHKIAAGTKKHSKTKTIPAVSTSNKDFNIHKFQKFSFSQERLILLAVAIVGLVAIIVMISA